MVVDYVSYSLSQFVANCLGEAICEFLAWNMAANALLREFGPAASLEDVVPADCGTAGAVAVFGESW
jgi:hypothetical protein